MKWSVVALLAICAYYFWFAQTPGEFDSSGNAKVVLFVFDDCPPCQQAVAHLKRMRIDFELLNPQADNAAAERFKKYRTRQYPLLVVGDVQTSGFSKARYTEAYAKVFGFNAIAKSQRRLYKSHFDGQQPKVVMYGTSWCGYCAKARKEFASNNIEFVEWDVEKNDAANARFKALGGTGYPLIYVGFERVDGFDKAQIKQALSTSLDSI